MTKIKIKIPFQNNKLSHRLMVKWKKIIMIIEKKNEKKAWME